MDLDQFIQDYTARAAKALPANTQSVTREVPTRAPSVTGDVWAPLLIALISALVVFLSVGAVAIAASWTVKVPLVIAGATLAAVWFGHLSKGWDRLIWAVEDITGIDANRDDVIGRPGEWSIVLVDERGNDKRLLFDSYDERLHAIEAARLIVQGTPCSEGALTGTNRPFSRTEFHRFRDQLFQRGYAFWIDPQVHTLGIGFTVAGKRAMKTLAGYDTTDSTTPARILTPRGTDALPAEVGQGRGEAL